ncbi:MAG TPA: ABC transporter permease [Oscillatoriales cyanobacterium M59_W2019_021]|nr:ABC transporter permease [Oscillatoriales cyanobacterium M4454_W2019_049]HIK49730.1 ABC transporter permease [Oscillatoriales cyanobacterium M59_W2019_021]
MNPFESFKMASQTLIANKMRSALTMLGIIIGNASVIATIGVGEGAQNFVSDQISSLGTNLLFILPGSPEAQRRPVFPPQTLVWDDAKAIAEQVPAVQAVAPQLNGSELVSYRNKNLSSSIYGVTPELLPVRNFDVAKGRFISDVDIKGNQQVAAIGSEVAERLFGTQNPLGEQIRVKNASFTIIGVMQPKGSSFGTNLDETVFVPLTTMAYRVVGQRSPFGLKVTFINVSITDESQMKIAQFQIENLLRLRHKVKGEDDFTVRNQKDLQETTGAITGALKIMLAAIASISLLVGGIGIMNIMLVSVTERTQEIGLRKAIGATQQDILLQFTIEAVILALVGGAIGTGIGVSGILAISALTPFNAGVSPVAIILATGVSGGIGLFFGVFPAQRAAKLDPIVALRTA